MRAGVRIIIGIISCLLCMSSCKNLQEVQCTGVRGFKVNKVNTQGIDADILLSLKNPNGTGFSIYSTQLDVTFGGIYLGKARLARRVHIHARAEETYRFNLKSDFKNISLEDIMSLVNGAISRSTVEVKGNLKAGKFYFFRKKFPVNVKERIRAF